MSPRKPSKSKKSRPAKGKPKKAKSIRRSKPAAKKAGRSKPAGQGGRKAVPVVFRRKGGEPAAADTVDTLGDWQHEHEVDTHHDSEDDIPPDYGGSE